MEIHRMACPNHTRDPKTLARLALLDQARKLGRIGGGAYWVARRALLIEARRRERIQARMERGRAAMRRANRNALRFQARTGIETTLPGCDRLGNPEYWDFRRNPVRPW